MIVRRGEVRSYLPGVGGRNKSTHIAGDKVVVISNDGTNRSLSTALVLPVHDHIDNDLSPAAMSLVIPLGDLDPFSDGAVIIYWPKVIPVTWFTDPIGMLSQATMRQVFAAFVDYVGV